MARMDRLGANHAAGDVRRRRKWPWVLLGVFVLLLALGVALGVFGSRFYREAKKVKDITKTMDTDALDQELPAMRKHTAKAREIAHGSLWNLAAKVPVYGDDIRTVQGMTEVVDDLAATTLPDLSNTLKTLMDSKLSNGGGQINMQPIYDIQKTFDATNTQIQRQYKKLKGLPKPHIGKVKQAYNQGLDQFSSIAEKLNQSNELLQILPQFLGEDGQRTYLIMANTTS